MLFCLTYQKSLLLMKAWDIKTVMRGTGEGNKGTRRKGEYKQKKNRVDQRRCKQKKKKKKKSSTKQSHNYTNR